MFFSFGLILLTVLLYGAIHSWMASLAFKSKAAKKLGAMSNRWFRIVYNLVASVLLIPVLLLPVLLIDQSLYQIPAPWYYLTMFIQALAALVALLVLLQTGLASFLGLCQVFRNCEGKPERLVVTGLYRWVRHPIYTASLVFIWLMPKMTLNLLALNLGITIYLVVGALLEERKLFGEYGPLYRDYQRHVAMLIPGLRWPTSHNPKQ